MSVRYLPLLLAPLLISGAAEARMLMRVFDQAGNPTETIDLQAIRRSTPATHGIGLEMSVFPSTPGGDAQRVPLTPLPLARAPVSSPARALDVDHGRPKLRLTAALAARRDDLRWSIADIDNQPDVLSELIWRKQKSLMFSVLGEAETAQGWLLSAEVGAATLLNGEIQDSDYDGDGRTQEWSRTLGESDDAGLMDLRIAAGRRFNIGAHALSASLGYAWHEQNLRVGTVTQVVSEPNSHGFSLPPTGSRFDAQSSYTARWYGPRLDLNLALSWPAGWGLTLGAWREWVDYKGSGNWALRAEFKHPESFTHRSDGRVSGIKAEWSRPWRKQGRLSLSWEKVRGRAGAGRDIVHFVDAGDASTRLNAVVWDNESLKLGARWAF
jgi:hypothetical protein